MNLVLLLSALVVLLCVAVSRSEIPNVSDPIVYTQSGIVRGRQRLTLFNRKPYNSFEGIPYAKPPIGELRFKVCIYSIMGACEENNEDMIFVF